MATKSYKKIYSNVLELNEKSKLEVSLQEVYKGKNLVDVGFKVWTMYLAKDGSWNYAGSTCTNKLFISLAKDDVLTTLSDELHKALALVPKYADTFAKLASPVVTTKLEDLSVEELEALLAKKKAKKSKSEKPAKSTKKERLLSELAKEDAKRDMKSAVDFDDLDGFANQLTKEEVSHLVAKLAKRFQ